MFALFTVLQVIAFFGVFWLMSASTVFYLISNAPAWEDQDERFDEE